MILKKNILLNDKNLGSFLLTLEDKSTYTLCSIKSFNNNKLTDTKIILCNQKQFIKANIVIDKTTTYMFKISDKVLENSDLTCAIVDKSNQILAIGGTNKINKQMIVEKLSENNLNNNKPTTNDHYNINNSYNHINNNNNNINNNKPLINDYSSINNNSYNHIHNNNNNLNNNKINNKQNLTNLNNVEKNKGTKSYTNIANITNLNNQNNNKDNNQINCFDYEKNLNDNLKNDTILTNKNIKNNNISNNNLNQNNMNLNKSFDNSKSVNNNLSNNNLNQNNMDLNIPFDNSKGVNDTFLTAKKHDDISYLFDSTDEEIEDEIDKEFKKDNSDFYSLISEQIDELFNKYPEEKQLSQVIPNSKWVKVDFENSGKYYVVGLIYEDDILKYVCYGVPSLASDPPPKDFADYCQFVPIDILFPQGKGYYIMYQDSYTGETIKIDN